MGRESVALVFGLVVGLAGGALGGGCATAAQPQARAADQDRALLDLRAKNSGYVRKIEELENRIFILEDQLDSLKLAAEQKAPAILPARTLRAGGRETGKSRGDARAAAGSPAKATQTAAARAMAPASAHGTAADDGTGPVETSIVAEHAVDYTGDAAETAGFPEPVVRDTPSGRPMLRLSSSTTATWSSATPVGRERSARASDRALAPEPGLGARDNSPARAAPDPLGAYRQALETLRAGHPDVALSTFRRFLERNPQHDYADNAQYWIGECLYAQQQFRAAERAFRDVVERYPRGNKVPDAMLKLGFTLQALGDEAQGRAVLESLARAFPKHEAARLASQRLAHPESDPARAARTPTFGTVLPLTTPSNSGVGRVGP